MGYPFCTIDPAQINVSLVIRKLIVFIFMNLPWIITEIIDIQMIQGDFQESFWPPLSFWLRKALSWADHRSENALPYPGKMIAHDRPGVVNVSGWKWDKGDR
jgi:hypothetical protein